MEKQYKSEKGEEFHHEQGKMHLNVLSGLQTFENNQRWGWMLEIYTSVNICTISLLRRTSVLIPCGLGPCFGNLIFNLFLYGGKPHCNTTVYPRSLVYFHSIEVGIDQTSRAYCTSKINRICCIQNLCALFLCFLSFTHSVNVLKTLN